MNFLLMNSNFKLVWPQLGFYKITIMKSISISRKNSHCALKPAKTHWERQSLISPKQYANFVMYRGHMT